MNWIEKSCAVVLRFGYSNIRDFSDAGVVAVVPDYSGSLHVLTTNHPKPIHHGMRYDIVKNEDTGIDVCHFHFDGSKEQKWVAVCLKVAPQMTQNTFSLRKREDTNTNYNVDGSPCVITCLFSWRPRVVSCFSSKKLGVLW